MTIRSYLRWFLWGFLLCLLNACHTYQPQRITGLVHEQRPLSHAQVNILDAKGQKITAKTNALGMYSLQTKGLTPPLLISVVAEGKAQDCSINSQLRPLCMAAILMDMSSRENITANINPLTDRIVSDIAASKGFFGPQQWVDSGNIGEVNIGEFNNSLEHLCNGFSNALEAIGIVDVARFDPAEVVMTDAHPLTEIFSLIHHNRNYHNHSGTTGHTVLTDFGFRPIVGLMPHGVYEPFDLQRARNEYQQHQSANTRIFIVGDSTSAVYEQLRYPRMGWGQAFAQQFNSGDGISVVVGSRAGRSSRDFYNGRWFAQMAELIQPGDYVFINHGHNDQNCDSAKPLRGRADVRNLCTYPNDAQGKPQHPPGQPELSFQHSLERYIRIARAKGAHPVLFTPTARIKNSSGKQTPPVVHTHFTRQNTHASYLFVGDYTETIRTTAKVHKVPLIDLEAATIKLANGAGEPGWRDYWLVVDPSVNSFYANNPGSTQTPDGTHFQKAGAEAIAHLVAEEIRKHEQLHTLAKKFSR